LFGVPDEITDLTRSLEMVERYRLIYWKAIFGHRYGSGVIRVFSGVPRGYRNPPGKCWANMGLREREGRSRGWPRAPLLGSPNRTRRRGRRPPSLCLSLSFLFPPVEERKKGGAESYLD
jgi:hypothetical protein